MSMFRRRQADSLQTELRRNRPEPREAFVRQLEATISANRPAGGRSFRGRVGLAAALTAALLVVAAVFGGYSYAASAIVASGKVVADAVQLNFHLHVVGQVSAAADQYKKVPLCHRGHDISVAEEAVDAHLAQGDTRGKCPVYAPPIVVTAANAKLDLRKSRVNDVIVATKGSNTITTNNRDNKVTTGAGNDVIRTGTGTNLVKSGAGNDTIISHGKDTIFAGAGDDTIDALNGKPNYVDCGPGRDIVYADKKLDFIANDCEIVRYHH